MGGKQLAAQKQDRSIEAREVFDIRKSLGTSSLPYLAESIFIDDLIAMKFS